MPFPSERLRRCSRPASRRSARGEGFTDAYRDLTCPGGIAEVGFTRLWSLALRRVRQSYRLTGQQRRHPLRDDWWRALVPVLADITWASFYSPQAREAQLRFFDHYLRGRDVPALPPARLEVREDRDVIAGVREERSWPMERTAWTPLYLTAAGLATVPPAAAGQITFDLRSQGACFAWTVPADTEITGPIALRLWVEAHGAADIDLFAGVEKWRDGAYVPFEGSYGFGRDRITTGWLKACDSPCAPATRVR